MATTLRWQTNPTVSAVYAAWVGFRRTDPVPEDAPIADALGRLRAALAEERVSPTAFWEHLFAAAVAGFHEPRQLATAALVKCIGQIEAPLKVGRFERILRELRQTAAPADVSPAQLQTAWQRHGAALLETIGQLTDPDLLLDEATVVGVAPSRGGGVAAVSANAVVIELIEPLESELPEAVRLAWLTAQLQLDLPRYSEALAASRRALVGAVAMLPAALEAARRCRLTEAPLEALLAAPGGAWLEGAGIDAAAPDVVARWWSVYQSRRPHFRTALEALAQALEPGRVA